MTHPDFTEQAREVVKVATFKMYDNLSTESVEYLWSNLAKSDKLAVLINTVAAALLSAYSLGRVAKLEAQQAQLPHALVVPVNLDAITEANNRIQELEAQVAMLRAWTKDEEDLA